MEDRRERSREGLAGVLRREVIPDPRGVVGFGILVALLAGHLMAFPDREGHLFGNLLAQLPGALRGPIFDASVDALFQAVLLLGPPASVYAALRHLALQGDSLLPYLTLAGGGFLTVLTCAAVLYALGSGAGIF